MKATDARFIDLLNDGKYIGGDLEIQNTIENYMYRGKIKSIMVADELKVGFEIFIKLGNEGWEKVENRIYTVNLNTANVSVIGDDRICLDTGSILNELCVFFLPGQSGMKWEEYV